MRRPRCYRCSSASPRCTRIAFNTTRIEDALRHIEKSAANALYLFLDAHRFLDDPVVLRQIKDIAAKSESTHRMLFLRFRPALPDARRIAEILTEEARRYREATGEQVKANRNALNVVTQHLGGLTEEDARRLARMAIRDDGAISGADIARVLKAKHELVAASEILALETGVPDIGELGGLGNLKRWLKVRREIS